MWLEKTTRNWSPRANRPTIPTRAEAMTITGHRPATKKTEMFAIVVASAIAVLAPTAAQDCAAPNSIAQAQLSLAPVVANVAPAVVEIQTVGGFMTVRSWVGARLSWPENTPAQSLADGSPRKRGAVVDAVFPGGPADRAGLCPGDRIISLNGVAVPDPIDFTFQVATMTIGQTAPVSAVRDGVEMTLNCPFDALPGSSDAGFARRPAKLLDGILLGYLSPALADASGLHPMDKGVVVLEFQGLGTSGQPRLEIGDVLVKINDQVISVVQQVANSVVEVRWDWKVTIPRGDTEFIFDVFL
jgi:S1-C subfamily serine protease